MRLWALFILNIVSIFAFAQKRYWIQFTDKNNSTYSTSNPQAFLTQRAIDRRINYNIAISANDIPVNKNYIDSVLSQGNVELIHQSKWFNAITIKTNDSLALVKINALPFVNDVKKTSNLKRNNNFESSFLFDQTVAKTGNWQINNFDSAYYGGAYDQNSMIGCDCLHNLGFRGNSQLIAIMDGGFFKVDSFAAFDSIRANNQIIATKDFINIGTGVYEDASHGMSVLSAMGAVIPGQMVGSAPDAQFVLLRTEQEATEFIIEEDNWVAAAEFADSIGVDIINTSLGYTTFDDNLTNHTYSEMDGNTTRITQAADIAAAKGIIVVVAAGNSGNDNVWPYIGAPADGDSVLTVGGVDQNKNRVSFSSVGPSSDGNIKPNVAAKAIGVSLISNNGSIVTSGGTSFAAPIIAGAMACLKQAFPGKNNMELIYAIEQSSNQNQSPDSLLGYGVPDFCLAKALLSGLPDPRNKDNQTPFIYPSPFNNELYISFFGKANEDVVISLTDLQGRIVYTETVKEKIGSYSSIRPSGFEDLNNGIYFINLHSNNFSFSQKLIHINR